MLQIRLFGKPQVICDGTDITPELGNKGCALLCILFLRGGDYYAREKLAAYLWPDSAASAAKYNLRYTLWKIKKSTDTGEGGRSLIKLDREYCCINRAYDYICDLQTIDEIDPETQSADELKRACDAFGGELLEGYYFNHCEDLNELILSQRIYYEKRKNRLLMKAVELYEQRDMLPEAVGILERVMEYEPYNEQLALRLMTLYERDGVQQLSHCVRHPLRQPPADAAQRADRAGYLRRGEGPADGAGPAGTVQQGQRPGIRQRPRPVGVNAKPGTAREDSPRLSALDGLCGGWYDGGRKRRGRSGAGEDAMKKIDNCENSTVLVALLLAGILLVMGAYRLFSWLCSRGLTDTLTWVLGAAALVLAALGLLLASRSFRRLKELHL